MTFRVNIQNIEFKARNLIFLQNTVGDENSTKEFNRIFHDFGFNALSFLSIIGTYVVYICMTKNCTAVTVIAL